MPRNCVLCRKAQSRSFSVFSFPVSVTQRAKWIAVVKDVIPDFTKDESIMDRRRRKNGICELHFLRSEISKGKKRRLRHQAVPSINISSKQTKCKEIINTYKSLMNSDNISDNQLDEQVDAQPQLPKKDSDCESGTNVDASNGDIPVASYSENFNVKTTAVLPDCTMQIEIEDQTQTGDLPLKVHKSLVDNIFYEREMGVCLCCGSKYSLDGLFSVLKLSVDKKGLPLIEELSNVFDLPKENIINYSTYLCRKCLKVIEDMLELRKNFLALVVHLKKKISNTRAQLNAQNESETFLEISNSDGLVQKDLLINSLCCSKCSATFRSSSALAVHNLNHENEQESYEYNNVSPSVHLNENQCPTCSKSYRSQTLLSKHLSCHQKKKFDCSHCGRLITSKAKLKSHLYKFHGIGNDKEKIFPCKFCERRFSSKAGLRYHDWSSHKKGKPFPCELCGMEFSYGMLYRSHKLFAHGDKTIVCEVCGKMFFTVSKLNVHINAVHRNAQSWLCKLCEAKFTTSSAYQHHVTVRHKRVLYYCTHCDAQFKRKISLTQHLWKHNEYNCNRCNTKFDDSMCFIIHMNNVHKVDVSKKFKSKDNIGEKSNNESLEDVTSPALSKKEVPAVVINDILMSSNNTIQSLSFQHDAKEQDEKSSFDDELTTVDTVHFDNVDSLEMQSVPNESIIEDDVSLINVQMLDDIDTPEHSNLKSLKDDILPCETEGNFSMSNLNMSHALQKEQQTSVAPRISAFENPQSIEHKLNIHQSLPVEVHKVVTNELSSPQSNEQASKDDLKHSLLAAKMFIPEEDSLVISEQIVEESQLVTSELDVLPDILRSGKSDSWPHDTFANSSNNPQDTFANTSDPQSHESFSKSLNNSHKISKVIHSLAVGSSLDQNEDNPPITREIDITIPSEDEETSKDSPMNDESASVNKIGDGELPTLAIDIGGKGEVHYKYVMYFDSTIEKS